MILSSMWANVIFGGTLTLFAGMTLASLLHLRWVRRLPKLDELGVGDETIARCSVVIAARDESARIENTVRHLLAQRGVELEVIVVDDRSTDGTSDILAGLAKEDRRLKVKRVDVLPEGWLGKCYACHAGVSAATGEWILFTDADCWLKTDVIVRGIRTLERAGSRLAFVICDQPSELVCGREQGSTKSVHGHRRV